MPSLPHTINDPRELHGVACSKQGGRSVRAPLDGAESSVAEEIIGEGDSLHRLMPGLQVGRGRIAARHGVLDSDSVGAVYTHGASYVPASNDLLSKVVRAVAASGAYPGDIVLAPRYLEQGPVAHDE